MTYASGIKTANHTAPTTADNFHLMRGRVDVSGHRGYYIIHPESSGNPPVLTANASNKTGVSAFSISDQSTTQRWLILSAEEAAAFESGRIDIAKKELEDLLAQLRQLESTPHTEDVEGADNTFSTSLSTIETEGTAATTPSALASLVTEAKEAGMTFLASVSASDISKPFDLTYMLQNPDFDTSGSEGWTTSKQPGYAYKESEFYETTFDFYQILEKMPKGFYQLRAQAFQRPGEISAVYNQYKAGNSNVSTVLYIGSTTAPVKNICDDSQASPLFNSGDGRDKQLGNGRYVPNTMEGTSKYFAKGLYDCGVSAEQKNANANLRVGIRGTRTASYYWSIFDHFRLYFYGQNDTVTGIEDVTPDSDYAEFAESSHNAWYTLDGRKLAKKPTTKGVYIINGKKVMVK